jgi:signal transduction histidine kinase/CheY-like chemotaxis protein
MGEGIGSILSSPWFWLGAIGLALLFLRWRMHSLASRDRMLRESIRKKTAELQEQTRRAQTSEKVKERFLANMSHEIRTPMNAVVGFTNLLLDGKPRGDQLRYLELIKQSADHLLVIINDILDLSRIEAGKMPIEQVPFDLHKLMEGVAAMLQVKADEKNLKVKLEIADGLPKHFVGDPSRINQILVNLGGNAVKFTESGSVTLKVRSKGSQLLFEVIDTGIGISAEAQINVFGSFTQASSDTNRKYGGTGLGLSISKHLVELMEGQVGLESSPGHGSRFYFELPLTEAAEVSEEQSEELKLDLPAGLRILLAEDNAMNQLLAVDSLESQLEAVQVDTAINGKEAVDKVKSDTYDMVLMDVNMPEMDGLESTQLIRKYEETNQLPHLPIMAMTASVLPQEIERCLAAGMDGHIPKPFEIHELLEGIQEALSIRDKKS